MPMLEFATAGLLLAQALSLRGKRPEEDCGKDCTLGAPNELPPVEKDEDDDASTEVSSFGEGSAWNEPNSCCRARPGILASRRPPGAVPWLPPEEPTQPEPPSRAHCSSATRLYEQATDTPISEASFQREAFAAALAIEGCPCPSQGTSDLGAWTLVDKCDARQTEASRCRREDLSRASPGPDENEPWELVQSSSPCAYRGL